MALNISWTKNKFFKNVINHGRTHAVDLLLYFVYDVPTKSSKSSFVDQSLEKRLPYCRTYSIEFLENETR